jgi:hypothetical protein
MRVGNFTDLNGAFMPIETKRLGNDQGNERIPGVGNENLTCWSTCARPAFVNKLPLESCDGSASNMVSILFCGLTVVHVAETLGILSWQPLHV